jgi:hypothetical protein
VLHRVLGLKGVPALLSELESQPWIFSQHLYDSLQVECVAIFHHYSAGLFFDHSRDLAFVRTNKDGGSSRRKDPIEFAGKNHPIKSGGHKYKVHVTKRHECGEILSWLVWLDHHVGDGIPMHEVNKHRLHDSISDHYPPDVINIL